MRIVCSVASCKYSSKNEDASSVIFISFPNNDTALVWALECGRQDLIDKPIEYLHANQIVCSNHIDDRFFVSKMNPIIVASGAIPTIFDESEDSTALMNSFENNCPPDGAPGPVESKDPSGKTEQISHSALRINSAGSEQRERILESNARIDGGVDRSYAGNENHFEAISIRLSNLCRICGQSFGEGIDIFSTGKSQLRMREIIRLHTPVCLESKDILPQKICIECCDKLEAVHSLVLTCIRTDLRLRKFLNIVGKPGYDPKYADLVTACTMNLADETTLDKFDDAKNPPKNSTAMENITSVDTSKEKFKEDSSCGHLEKVEICSIVDLPEKNISNVEYTVNPDFNHLLMTLGVEGLKNSGETGESSSIRNVDPEILINCPAACSNCKNVFETLEVLKKHVCDTGNMQNPRQKTGSQTDEICNLCGYLFSDEKDDEKHKISCLGPSSKFHHRTSAEFVNEKDNPNAGVPNDEKSRSIVINRRCGYCPLFFETRRELQSHIADRHDARPLYKCGMCEKTYEKWSSLDVHEATHRIDKPYLCDLCGKSFKHSNNLRGHKRTHLDASKKKRHVCNVCGNAFRSRFHLREHMNQHNGNKPYSCENCGKAFCKRIQLRQHSLSHESKKYPCPICGVTFNRRGNMNSHLKRHNKDEGTYTCSVCGHKCKSMSELKMHRKEHSERDITESIRMKSGDNPTWRCSVCAKIFPKRILLLNHEMTHREDREKIECDKCGKKLANKTSLRYHSRSLHSMERPHMCQFCGESFVAKDSRLIHERIHTGERPYVCQICQMEYRCSSNLSQHMKIHSSLRPYVCQSCNKTFTRKGALNVHERIHTGLKPFLCGICNRGFSQKNDMIKHSRTHRSKFLRCEKCDESFENKSEILEHLKSHETNNVDQTLVSDYEMISEPFGKL